MNSLKELVPFKVNCVNEEYAIKVQEILFSHGVDWLCPDTRVNRDALLLLVNESCEMYYWGSGLEHYDDFIRGSKKEMLLSEILKYEKKESPDEIIQLIDNCDFGCQQKNVKKLVSMLLERTGEKK